MLTYIKTFYEFLKLKGKLNAVFTKTHSMNVKAGILKDEMLLMYGSMV